MGQPATVAAGVGSLSYGRLFVEPRWGAVYDFITGAATQTAGATTITLRSVGQAQVGMYVYFKDNAMPTSNKAVLNLTEPPIKVTGVNTTTNTLTLSTATTQTHYGVQSNGIVTSGSQVVVAWPSTTGFYYQSETLTSTDNPQSTQLMTGSRIGRQNLMQGQEDVMGNIQTPLGPGWGMEFLASSTGFETESYAAGTPTGTGTFAAATAVGANTFTTTDATIVANAIIQIDVAPNRELRPVLSVSGSGTFTVTLGYTLSGTTYNTPLRFAHASGVAVKTVPTALYSHYLSLANTLPSLTIEKIIAGDAQFNGAIGTVFPVSFLYTGMYVNKAVIKGGNKSWPEVTYDFLGQGESAIPASVVGAYPRSVPFMFSDLTTSVDGAYANNFSDFELTIDNKLIKDYFFNGTRKVGVIKPGPRMVEGKLVYYFTDYAQYEAYKNRTSHSLSLTWLQASTGYSIQLVIPNVVYTTWAEKSPFAGLVTVDASFYAVQDPTLGTEAYMVVTDGNYLNYV